jgi:hypothetical protein
MAKLNIQQALVPNTLLKDARSELGQEFCDLPLRMQIGYLRVFQGNYIIDKSNRHIEHHNSFKLSTKDLDDLFGEAKRFRSVNTNGYYLLRRGNENDPRGKYRLCRKKEKGSIYCDPLQLIHQTYKGHKDPTSKEKGVLSGYQLSDKVKSLMHNRVYKQAKHDRNDRYFLDSNGKRIDDKDLNAKGINRSKSSIANADEVNTRRMAMIVLPSMLNYRLMLNSIEEWVDKFGTYNPDYRKQGKKIIEVPNWTLEVGGKCWYMLYQEVSEKSECLESIYDDLVKGIESEVERSRSEVVSGLVQAIEVEKELHQAAKACCLEESLPTSDDVLVALDGVNTNNKLSKSLKTLLQEDLDLMDIRGQLHELEELIGMLEESNSWRVPIIYDECRTGRYFSRVLQGYHKEVRYAAFRHHYAYDIEAAHPNILVQLMKRKGIQFDELDVMHEYVDNKKGIRLKLAKELDTSVEIIKSILQIFAYGSRLSESSKEGLYECCKGNMGLIKKVKQHQWIQSYRDAFIIALDKMHKNKERIVNAVGIESEEEKDQKSQMMAHKLQGYERQVIDVIIRHWEFGSIALLLHDCVVFTGRVNPDDINQVVKDETGFDLSFEEEKY